MQSNRLSAYDGCLCWNSQRDNCTEVPRTSPEYLRMRTGEPVHKGSYIAEPSCTLLTVHLEMHQCRAAEEKQLHNANKLTETKRRERVTQCISLQIKLNHGSIIDEGQESTVQEC